MVERYPEGMEKILGYLRRKFRLPIYITEHGSASADEEFRAVDLRQNLAALHRSIQAGADVRGFFYWSLLDNFEWQFGYAKKFGLLAVDFADPKLPRSKKPLADVYSRICRENGFVAEPPRS
jgi:beta-glucosidase